MYLNIFNPLIWISAKAKIKKHTNNFGVLFVLINLFFVVIFVIWFVLIVVFDNSNIFLFRIIF